MVIFLTGYPSQYISQIKKDICAEYDMTDMGELDNFLNAKITISQTHYCREVLKKFDFLVRDKVTKSPLPSDALEQLAQAHEMTPSEQSDVNSYPYRQIIGALLYVAMYTKPEISYAVGVLSRYNENKTYASCKLATNLLRYLQGHQECIIEFAGSSLDLHCFNDADWRVCCTL